MWILKWLPDWIFYVTLLAGVVGYLATYLLRFIPIPFVYVYKNPIQLGSIALIVIGTFMSGAIYDNNAWLDRVHEMEEKVAKAEQESKEANTKIDNKTEQSTIKIVEKKVLLKEYVDRVLTKQYESCVISKEFIETINKAAEDERK
jgi:hypothetical protein